MGQQSEAMRSLDRAENELAEAKAAVAELEDLDTEDVREKLYDLTSQAESLAASIANLRNSDLSDILSDITEVESEGDELAQALRDYHSEL